MKKLFTAKMAARGTMVASLRKEIPPIYKKIENAMNDGKFSILYDADQISVVSENFLMKMNFEIEDYKDMLKTKKISWEIQYESLCQSRMELKRLARNANIEIPEKVTCKEEYSQKENL